MLKDLHERAFVDYRLAIGQLIVSGISCQWRPAQYEPSRIPAHILCSDGTVIPTFRDGASYKVKSELVIDLIGS